MLQNPCSGLEDNSERSEDLTRQPLENFLLSVERRAYGMALTALGDREDALDVVQEAMTQLVVSYADRPDDQWRPLFYRILQNKITDLQRRRSIQGRFRGWLSRFRNSEDGAEQEGDPFETVAGPEQHAPHQRHELERQISVLKDALATLPARQQQAFILRCWEGMDTAETAITMKCSEGSVKTHYSRAIHRLREILGDHWYE
ncbi:MAG: RNA polymerase sigma factor [Gammaproteobacteria bacterium]|nr:MAG: RNA polymerase sigma factor [Gammaproteobacteria bacterium]